MELVGMRALAQAVSALSCESNRSTHRQVLSEVRNRLAPATYEALVYIFIPINIYTSAQQACTRCV